LSIIKIKMNLAAKSNQLSVQMFIEYSTKANNIVLDLFLKIKIFCEHFIKIFCVHFTLSLKFLEIISNAFYVFPYLDTFSNSVFHLGTGTATAMRGASSGLETGTAVTARCDPVSASSFLRKSSNSFGTYGEPVENISSSAIKH